MAKHLRGVFSFPIELLFKKSDFSVDEFKEELHQLACIQERKRFLLKKLEDEVIPLYEKQFHCSLENRLFYIPNYVDDFLDELETAVKRLEKCIASNQPLNENEYCQYHFYFFELFVDEWDKKITECSDETATRWMYEYFEVVEKYCAQFLDDPFFNCTSTSLTLLELDGRIKQLIFAIENEIPITADNHYLWENIKFFYLS